MPRCDSSGQCLYNDMLSAAEPGDRVEADEVIAQIETDKVFVCVLVSVFSLLCRFLMIK